jgi:hypothetical protein
MASSPQYLAHGAHDQVGTNTPTLPDGSCPSGQPTTVSAYPDPDQIYSSVSLPTTVTVPPASLRTYICIYIYTHAKEGARISSTTSMPDHTRNL